MAIPTIKEVFFMNGLTKCLSYLNPYSPEHHAVDDFKNRLKPSHQWFVGFVTGLVAVVTFPTFGLLGMITFRYLVIKFKAVDITPENADKTKFPGADKTQELGIKLLFKKARKLKLDPKKIIEDLKAENAPPLILAIVNNDIKEIERLLKEGADLNAADSRGSLPMHWAAWKGNLDIFKRVFKSEKIDSTNQDNLTALSIATIANKGEIVKYLLGLNAKTNIRDGYEQRRRLPLHEAAINGDLESVKLFLVSTDKNTVDSKGRTALSYASKFGKMDVINFLLEKEVLPRPDNKAMRPLHWAVLKADLATVKRLIPIHKGNIDSQDDNGDTALIFAAREGKAEIVKLLLENGASAIVGNLNYVLPIHWAALKLDLKTIKLLYRKTTPLEKINTQDSEGKTVLHYAVESGRDSVVKLFLKRNVEIKADENGWLPLHCAAMKGSLDIVKTLLPETNDINAKSAKDVIISEITIPAGTTAYQIAVLVGKKDVQAALSKAGAVATPAGPVTP